MTTTPPTITPTRYWRAPVITEAVQWDGTTEHANALIKWMDADPEHGIDPEAKPEYWLEHHSNKRVMAFKCFGRTDYAGAGDWVVRCNAGVYAPQMDVSFRILFTEAGPYDVVLPSRSRFSVPMLCGIGSLVVLLATLANMLTLWYGWDHLSLSTFCIAMVLNCLWTAGLSALFVVIRKRFP